jgi:hypothetical protein
MEFSKRRLLIKAITRGLEKALHVTEDTPQPVIIETHVLPYTPMQLEEQEQKKADRLDKVIPEIRFILKVVPNKLKRRLVVFPGWRRIEELVNEVGLRNLPQDLIDELATVGIWE